MPSSPKIIYSFSGIIPNLNIRNSNLVVEDVQHCDYETVAENQPLEKQLVDSPVIPFTSKISQDIPIELTGGKELGQKADEIHFASDQNVNLMVIDSAETQDSSFKVEQVVEVISELNNITDESEQDVSLNNVESEIVPAIDVLHETNLIIEQIEVIEGCFDTTYIEEIHVSNLAIQVENNPKLETMNEFSSKAVTEVPTDLIVQSECEDFTVTTVLEIRLDSPQEESIDTFATQYVIEDKCIEQTTTDRDLSRVNDHIAIEKLVENVASVLEEKKDESIKIENQFRVENVVEIPIAAEFIKSSHEYQIEIQGIDGITETFEMTTVLEVLPSDEISILGETAQYKGTSH